MVVPADLAEVADPQEPPSLIHEPQEIGEVDAMAEEGVLRWQRQHDGGRRRLD